MINALNLIWIVPLSMIIGAISLICISCIVVGRKAEIRFERREEDKEDGYDY